MIITIRILMQNAHGKYTRIKYNKLSPTIEVNGKKKTHKAQ